MAKVELPSIETTKEKCAGCGKDINLFTPHLKVTVKAERGVPITQSVSEFQAVATGEPRTEAEILAAVDVDEEEEQVTYMGWRTGAGDLVRVHNGECAAEYLTKKHKAEQPKIKYFRPDEDHYETVGRSSE